MTDQEATAATNEKHSLSEVDEKTRDGQSPSQDGADFDPVTYHEHNAGRLVVDPEYALL